MEYPDKDEKSDEYIAKRLEELNGVNLTEEEKNKIRSFGYSAIYSCYEILKGEPGVLNSYVVDSFDTLFNYFLINKLDENEMKLATEMLDNLARIKGSIYGLNELIKKLEDSRQTLEKKVTSRVIIEGMKGTNQK